MTDTDLAARLRAHFDAINNPDVHWVSTEHLETIREAIQLVEAVPNWERLLQRQQAVIDAWKPAILAVAREVEVYDQGVTASPQGVISAARLLREANDKVERRSSRDFVVARLRSLAQSYPVMPVDDRDVLAKAAEMLEDDDGDQ